jgi:hypothetical protein
MKRSVILGAALLLAAAIAVPVVAWSADNPPQSGQPAPIIPPMDQGAAPGQGPGGMGMMGRPGMMAHGGWRHRMMMMRMLRMTPQQRCEERLARRAGIVAYTIAKLNLTAAQRPLWGKMQSVLQAAGERQRQVCATLKDVKPGEMTVLDRMERREQSMSARLHDLQQIRPAMQQFYQALTPAQQAILNHPFRPS